MRAYISTLTKLAAGISRSPSLKTTVEQSSLSSGQTSVPSIRVPKIDVHAGKPGFTRSVSKPRPTAVKPAMPTQANKVIQRSPPEIRS